jgi:hypothetical protein
MKVEIIIEEGRNYCKSHKDGAAFTSVNYFGKKYGGASPCDTEEQIKSCVESAKEWIRSEGDIPIVVDTRVKATLMNWVK